MASVNLKNLDFKTAGFWPEPFKFGAYAVAFVAVIVISWFGWFSSEMDRWNSLTKKEADLRVEFEKVQGHANSLPALKEQLTQIDILLKSMVQQLPSKNEIPDLVINVSQAALGNGLAVDLFHPQDEARQDFYAEKKIEVKMRGGYHQLGKFFSDVAKQPRLVAVVIDDMKIALAPALEAKAEEAISNLNAPKVEGAMLEFSGSVRTYRYLSEDEEAEAASAAADKADKGRKRAKPAKPAKPSEG